MILICHCDRSGTFFQDTVSFTQKNYWTPKISLDEGIRRAVAWYLTNTSWLFQVKV